MWASKKVSAEAALEEALGNHAFFKPAAHRLEEAPPEKGLAMRLVRAYEAGEAEPWFTAHLLGCIGHEAGYETVLAILWSSPGLLAESYAGVALARIRGEGARSDLERTLSEAPKRLAREGAAYGLAALGSPAGGACVVDAIRDRRIRPHMGAVLEDMGLLDSLVLELFDSETERDRQAAFHAVSSALAHEERVSRVPRAAAGAMIRALDDGRVQASPQTRERIMEHAQAVLAGRPDA